MITSKKKWLSLLLLLMISGVVVTSFGSCTKTPELQEIETFDIIRQSGDTLEIEIKALMKNPNSIGANVTKVDAEIFIDGKQIGLVKHTGKIKLKAKKSSSVSMVSLLHLPEFSKQFPNMMEKDSCLLEIKGKYQVKVGIAKFNLSRDLKKKMAFKSIIEDQIQKTLAKRGIAIRKIWPSEVKLGKSEWEIDFLVYNDFGIDYHLDAIKADINMADNKSEFGKVDVSDTQLIKKQSSKKIASSVSINNIRAFSQALGSVFGKKEVTVSGHAWVRIGKHKFKVPFSQTIGLGS